MTKDTIATVVGGVLAAATSAEPVINAVDGTFDKTDVIKLVIAVITAIFGYFTNKKDTVPA